MFVSYSAELARLVDLLASLADRKFLGFKAYLNCFAQSRDGTDEGVPFSAFSFPGHD